MKEGKMDPQIKEKPTCETRNAIYGRDKHTSCRGRKS